MSPRLLIFSTLDSIQLMIGGTIESELPVMIMSSAHSRTVKTVKTHISYIQHFIPVSGDVTIVFMSL